MKRPWWLMPFLVVLIIGNNWWIRNLPLPNGTLEEGLLLLITLLNIIFFCLVVPVEEQPKATIGQIITMLCLLPIISYIFLTSSDWSLLESLSYFLFIGYCIGYGISKIALKTKKKQ